MNECVCIFGAGVLVVQREKDTWYGLTLVWSLAAVYGNQSNSLVAVSALACIGALLVVGLLRCACPVTKKLGLL